MLFLDPGDSELVIFVHLHSNADFINAPRIPGEKILSMKVLNCFSVLKLNSNFNVNDCLIEGS